MLSKISDFIKSKSVLILGFCCLATKNVYAIMPKERPSLNVVEDVFLDRLIPYTFWSIFALNLCYYIFSKKDKKTKIKKILYVFLAWLIACVVLCLLYKDVYIF